jgi:hypothetical protein
MTFSQNGYSRQDYYDNGMHDDAIAELGLDQPSAPAPGIAGIVLADLIMGKEWHCFLTSKMSPF